MTVDDAVCRVPALPAFADLKYRLLGPVAGPVRLGGAKQRTVLAALLLDAGRVVPEERLIALLWDDRPPASARGQLQVRVWELRKLLGREVIVRRPPGYLIEVRPGELDTALFDDIAENAHRLLASGEPRRAVELLRAGLELWQGPPLGGVTDALVRRSGGRLAARRMAVLETLFDAELALGRHTHVVRELRDCAAEYPFGERLHEQLMLALQGAGRTPEALAVYARFTAELGVDPGERLRAVQLRLLKGEDPERTRWDGGRTAGTGPRSGVPGAGEAVWLDGGPAARAGVEPPQVIPRLAERTGEPPWGDGGPVAWAGLPPEILGLGGREAELDRLDRRLAARGGAYASDVWVVHGAAGAGKTALALHWARRVRDRFPDGQLYLDLRGSGAQPVTPASALERLLCALGADPRRIPDEVDARAGRYRSLLADRQVLVVLDDARDAEQVLPLLPPTGTVLVTSRHRLGRLVAEFGAFPLGLPADPR